jgi:His/Glu/Gln/Arg/opine family amino acid ABC transporter permease subunit
MDFQVIVDSIPALFGGLGLTVQITALALVLGFVAAVPLAMLRVSRNPILWTPVYGYIFFFRGTPLLVQIFLIYYGSGQ